MGADDRVVNYPLSGLFTGPAQALLDHGVQRSTTAASLCVRLEGRSFAIDTGNPELNIFFMVCEGRLELHPGAPERADATVSGTPLTLAWLVAADPEQVIRSNDIDISGKAGVVEDYRLLLDIVRPDWEDELSNIVGDAVAYEMARAARIFTSWMGLVGQSFGRSVVEFLTEESRDLVALTEIEEFNEGVDEVYNAVERLAARLKILREQFAGQSAD
jgi:ubiquinone biosynthesis protein UbiJ